MAKKKVEPKRWAIRGQSTDGMMVTLGRYETEEEAKDDLVALTKEGRYRDMEILKLDVPDPPPDDEEGGDSSGDESSGANGAGEKEEEGDGDQSEASPKDSDDDSDDKEIED